jgi:8-oxo-dGTP pyrophosphatase MutT (NUDIX family)
MANKRDLHYVAGVCTIYRKIDNVRRYLLTQRPHDAKDYPSQWGNVGGKLKRSDYEKLPRTLKDGWDNPMERAVRREVWEEVRLKVGHLSCIGSFSFINSANVPVAGFRYVAPYVSGSVTLKRNELIAYEWVLAEEAGKFDCMGGAAEYILRFEKDLREKEIARAAT